MNKKGFWKVLMVSLIMATAIGLMANGAIAQTVNTQEMLQDEYGLQVGGTVILDNFQYWNSPRDMGWTPIEPAYPLWGAGIGLGSMETVVDFQEGSRVLEVFCPTSVFLPMGGPNFMPYTISKEAKFRQVAGGQQLLGIPGAFSSMSLKIKAPVSIELFDTFSVIVRVRTMVVPSATASSVDPFTGKTLAGAAATAAALPASAQDVDIPIGANQVGCPTCWPAAPGFAFGIADIVFSPKDTQIGCTADNVVQRITSPQITAGWVPTAITAESAIYAPNGQVLPGAPNPSRVEVALGRQFQDGSWHFIQENLATIVGTVFGQQIFEILGVTIRGNGYRLDDIMFTIPQLNIGNNSAPYLFKIGPIYGQLFNVQQSRLIFAEDADNICFMTDAALAARMQADEGFEQKVSSLVSNMGPAAITAFLNRMQNINAAAPDFPFIEDDAGLTPGGKAITGATANPNTFNAAQARFRIGYVPAQAGPPAVAAQPAVPFNVQNLQFRTTVGDVLGPQSTMVRPFTIPYANAAELVTAATANGLPPIIPAFGVPSRLWVSNTGAANASNPMFALACAMANLTGNGQWVGMQVLTPSGGQVLEDMIITCRVTDGIATDMETFPISVVNYPVTNLPPVIEQLEDQFFQVGEQGVYQITAIDPDSFTNNVVNQGAADQIGLTFRATLNGLPNYQTGPWMSQIINPTTGTISFTPQFEGALTCVVTVSDPRGMQAIGHFTIFCVNSGTWLNHPPVVQEIIESPQVIRAGQLFTISDLNIIDPDAQIQQLYYSCNVGAVGRNGVYTFQSEFPGEYLVQITAYDILGGAVTQQFVLQVMPWWSF